MGGGVGGCLGLDSSNSSTAKSAWVSLKTHQHISESADSWFRAEPPKHVVVQKGSAERPPSSRPRTRSATAFSASAERTTIIHLVSHCVYLICAAASTVSDVGPI